MGRPAPAFGGNVESRKMPPESADPRLARISTSTCPELLRRTNGTTNFIKKPSHIQPRRRIRPRRCQPGPLAHLSRVLGQRCLAGAGGGRVLPDPGRRRPIFHAIATTATSRRQLIAFPDRIATSARRLVLHLPRDWPWQGGWEHLFAFTC